MTVKSRNVRFVFTFFLCIAFGVLITCKQKKQAKVHLENDSIKVMRQVTDQGEITTKFHYDRFKRLVFIQVLSNDSLKSITYYDQDRVSYDVLFISGNLTQERRYSTTGEVIERLLVTSQGEILQAESYLEDGSRDTTIYPYVFVNMSQDGKIAQISARFLNVDIETVFTYKPTELLVGGDLDTVDLLVRDTLIVAKPSQSYEYSNIVVDARERKIVFCQFLLSKIGDSVSEVRVIPVQLKQSKFDRNLRDRAKKISKLISGSDSHLMPKFAPA